MTRIVHIGYPKTGTTFLQKEVFSKIRGMNYVDTKKSVGLFSDLIHADHLDVDFGALERSVRSCCQKGINLFSNEALTGSPYVFKGMNRSQIAYTLKEVGFEKVIITVRNQLEMIDSLYRQYVVQGGTLKFKDFMSIKISPTLRGMHPSYLCFDRLVDHYVKLFGKENVLVICQEHIKKDLPAVLNTLSDFTGFEISKVSGNTTPQNISLTNTAIGLMRVLNHFLNTMFRPSSIFLFKLKPKYLKYFLAIVADPYFFRFFSQRRSYLHEGEKLRYHDYYGQSNLRLQEITRLPLEELGYPMPVNG